LKFLNVIPFRHIDSRNSITSHPNNNIPREHINVAPKLPLHREEGEAQEELEAEGGEAEGGEAEGEEARPSATTATSTSTSTSTSSTSTTTTTTDAARRESPSSSATSAEARRAQCEFRVFYYAVF
jgi:hypothetical protein